VAVVGFLQHSVLYYSQQLLSMEIKSIYLVSKPATVVHNGCLDPCISLGWRNNSFAAQISAACTVTVRWMNV